MGIGRDTSYNSEEGTWERIGMQGDTYEKRNARPTVAPSNSKDTRINARIALYNPSIRNMSNVTGDLGILQSGIFRDNAVWDDGDRNDTILALGKPLFITIFYRTL